MMKISVSVVALSAALMLASPVMAQRSQNCSYSPLQNLIRSANDVAEIEKLVQKNVKLNAPVRCGGSLAALAVMRGNANVLKVLLNNGIDIDTPVKSADFGLGRDYPAQIPLILFAAHFAPNAEVLKALIDAGSNMAVIDEKGENISWYLDKNPVLRETPLAEEINNILLYQSTPEAPAVNTEGVAEQKAE